MPHRPPDASAPSLDSLEQLVALLRNDDVDAAIDAGLMAAWPDMCADVLDADARALLLDARARLRTAWDARARFEARNARLARLAEEREIARRIPAPASAAADAAPARPALPTNAAAILARAKARAAGGTS
ncbi:hypothetical protein [Luteimonas terrae]|uniref:Uncharacterized protein n=1 Tax=Luteimonas terrae TaxID=1530191 RepID=A0ABU1Y1Q8_9GAMM|nr:hypothetical protein [Luteimonas terrae]MDR7194405.1 hypothetical protein [Luteimonas terrae]